jgi:hypothetical protein
MVIECKKGVKLKEFLVNNNMKNFPNDFLRMLAITVCPYSEKIRKNSKLVRKFKKKFFWKNNIKKIIQIYWEIMRPV